MELLLLQRLQVFAWLETYGLSGRDVHFGAGPGVPADPRLPRLDRENAKTSQLNPIIGLESVLHAVEDRIDRLFRFCFTDSRPLNDLIHKIEFDHWNLHCIDGSLPLVSAISFVNIFLPSGGALGNAN